jgi:hypothetical protein
MKQRAAVSQSYRQRHLMGVRLNETPGSGLVLDPANEATPWSIRIHTQY